MGAGKCKAASTIGSQPVRTFDRLIAWQRGKGRRQEQGQTAGAGSPWVVIDYKTDFEVKGRLEEYQNQVSLYALAISRATGLETQAVLLRL